MRTKIQKWGNSQGLRINRSILEDAQIEVGDEVDVSVQEGKIVVSPGKKTRGRYDLKDLVARIPEDYQPAELDWGEPVGKEVW